MHIFLLLAWDYLMYIFLLLSRNWRYLIKLILYGIILCTVSYYSKLIWCKIILYTFYIYCGVLMYIFLLLALDYRTSIFLVVSRYVIILSRFSYFSRVYSTYIMLCTFSHRQFSYREYTFSSIDRPAGRPGGCRT